MEKKNKLVFTREIIIEENKSKAIGWISAEVGDIITLVIELYVGNGYNNRTKTNIKCVNHRTGLEWTTTPYNLGNIRIKYKEV